MFPTAGTEAVGLLWVLRSFVQVSVRMDEQILELRILFTTHFQVCLCQNVLIEVTFFFSFLKIYRYESETGFTKYSTPQVLT